MGLELQGKAGFRFDDRWGRSGSDSPSSTIDHNKRRALIACQGVLSRQNTAKAFGVHVTTVDRIWKKARQDAYQQQQAKPQNEVQ